MKKDRERRLSGHGISPGYGIGTALRLDSEHLLLPQIEIAARQVEAEVRRLKSGLKTATRQLRKLRDRMNRQIGQEHASVLDAHVLMLEDRSFVDEVIRSIRQRRVSAELAVKESAEQIFSIYRSSDDEFFRERGRDFLEVTDRLIRVLGGIRIPHGKLPNDVVLVSEHFSLGMMAELDLSRVHGVVVASGGWTSHSAIIARSLEIPVVSGIPNLPDVVTTGQRVALDGYRGVVWVEPTARVIQQLTGWMAEDRSLAGHVTQGPSGPCATSDGVRIRVEVNTEIPEEIDRALDYGAEGIGLYRSEFLFLRKRLAPPSEQEQVRTYRKLSEAVGHRKATIRTLDLGEERLGFLSQLADEGTPALGLRGIRLGLKNKKILRDQLSAILRANLLGNLHVVFPMISSVDEVTAAREILSECAAGLKARGIAHRMPERVGIMLEVPGAVWTADVFAPLVDFFCVGTNDFLQYTLAVDRTNEKVAHLAQPLHPGILRSLKQLVDVGERHRITVKFCGEVASNPLYCLVLLGLGATSFSMNSHSIPLIRRLLRSVSCQQVRTKVAPLLEMSSPDQMCRYAAQKLEPLLPEDLRRLLASRQSTGRRRQ